MHFNVSKDRHHITCEKGFGYIMYFLSGEPRAVSKESKKTPKGGQYKKWVLQVGPDSRHTIEIEKKYSASKIATLTVDGELMAEANGEDMECATDRWECNFRFCGERSLNWEVHETDGGGQTLDKRGLVETRQLWNLRCNVAFSDSILDASLTVDGLDHENLPVYVEPHAEEKLDCNDEALLASFNLRAPYKVDPSAYREHFGLGVDLPQLPTGFDFFSQLFGCCAASTVVPAVTENDVARGERT